MKILLVPILVIALFLSTMTFASAQTSSISVSFVSSFGSGGSKNGQFTNPQGIALDQSGNIYVADQQNNRIQKFDSSGNFLSQIGSLGSGDGQAQCSYQCCT